MRSASAALLRRVDAVEAEVAQCWLARVVAVLSDELKRGPETVARRVIQRLSDLHHNQHGDPAVRHGDDWAAIILRAVREVAPDLADSVDQKLGLPSQEYPK
jgi:hypothetical protein